VQRRGGFALPLLLIALGILLLLSNLGYLGWDVWAKLARLWPLFLIAAGIDLMLGRGGLRWWLATLVLLALVALAALVVLDVAFPGTEHAIRRELGEAKRASIEISCSGCRLELDGGAGPGVLVEGTVETGWAESLRRSFRVEDGAAELVLESQGIHPFRGFPSGARDWELSLSPEVPLSLVVSTGVGSAELNLAGLQLEWLELEAGVGEVEVVLPARGDYSVRITGGIGEVTVVVPEGLGVRVRAEVGVGELKVPGDFVRQDGVFLSPDYGAAGQRVELEVKSGVGKVSIVRRASL